MTQQINNKRVLKNTLMLYIRMGLVMIISLYTSRVLLEALGIEDYGIYNIVGGIVIMFSFFNNILTVAIRRFLSIAIASGDVKRVQIVLKASVKAVIIIACVLAFLIETVGLWFLNYKLNIPDNRLYAANCVFQLSLISFILNLNALPYNSAIVAYERMHIYAYIGIVEVILKLVFTFCILYINAIDKLILYAFLFFLLSTVIRFVTIWYCRNHIVTMEKDVIISQKDIVEIFKFSSWAVMGSIVYMIATQGVNIAINLFYGVLLNAAMGIASQISNAVSQFGGNFITAYNPPLTKIYANEGMSDNTYAFTVRVTKLTILLMSLIGLPIILNISEILSFWLKEVPPYSEGICVIMIIYIIIDIISSPLYILVYAKGDVKQYSILLSIIQIVYVIVFSIACVLGANPIEALSFNVLCALALHIGRLYILKKKMNFSVSKYCMDTVCPILLPLIIIVIVSLSILSFNFSNMLLSLTIKVFSIESLLCVIMYYLYLNKQERKYIITIVKNKVNKII